MIRSFFSICLLIALLPSLLIYSIDNCAFIVTNIDLLLYYSHANSYRLRMDSMTV